MFHFVLKSASCNKNGFTFAKFTNNTMIMKIANVQNSNIVNIVIPSYTGILPVMTYIASFSFTCLININSFKSVNTIII